MKIQLTISDSGRDGLDMDDFMNALISEVYPDPVEAVAEGPFDGGEWVATQLDHVRGASQVRPRVGEEVTASAEPAPLRARFRSPARIGLVSPTSVKHHREASPDRQP